MFFGELRSNEIEVGCGRIGFKLELTSFIQHLFESLWYSLTDTALAFTAFRDDFSPAFFAIFCFLLFVKAFHTLVGDRIDLVG